MGKSVTLSRIMGFLERAVAISRALAAQPQCILYNEPITMVDSIMYDHLSDLMPRLKHQLRLTSVVADLAKQEHPHIKEFLEMDRVERV